MDKKTQMKAIAEKVGRDRAIELVTSAYNTELVTNWLAHIEAAQKGKVGGPKRRDHLGDAIARVSSVCELLG